MDNPIYPIGIQSFEQLREYGYAYVDKTEYVYRLSREPKCFFLSRPRRFGKSLLLSTFEAFFKGKKELFDGLAISKLEKDWIEYPVLHFDFSRAEGDSAEFLVAFIRNRLKEMEDFYGVDQNDNIESIGDRFGTLITNINKKTNKKVVVLIDEYDKGIIETIESKANLLENQRTLQPFFSQIKGLGSIIRFAFITGVARFRHYTIFSGFNNPDDISLDEDYAQICGISLQELKEYFSEGLKLLADKYETNVESILDVLRLKYDGYRFTAAKEYVFNPFSILNCLSKKRLENFWIKSGTSKTFVKYLGQTDFDLTTLEDLHESSESLESVFSVDNPIPLLFQCGYLTITDYHNGLYKLGFPNSEVKESLVTELIPYYTGISEKDLRFNLSRLKEYVHKGEINSFISIIKSMISSIPYHLFDYENIEKTYHLIVYEIFLMLGVETQSEISLAGGRIDMVINTPKFVYVIEFKLGGTAAIALNQIEEKGYAIPWKTDDRKIYKIGIVFSPSTRTIESWKAVEA